MAADPIVDPAREETIRRIARERDELALAVADLRGQLNRATDVKAQAGRHLAPLAAGAVAAGFLLAGGVGATFRLAAVHQRVRRERRDRSLLERLTA